MTPYYDQSGVRLYEGDCRHVLAALPASSVDTVITDPPYGLAFMGKEWDHLVPGVEYWAEVLRVAKPGAMLLAFGGTRTYHRLACAIEDAGWEVRDCLMWLYGSGFPKSHDISKGIDKAAGAEREAIGLNPHARPSDGIYDAKYGTNGHDPFITAPSTDAAKLWHGWGTALKPAWEPILLAMKPTDGTFAENALAHGVAGLHIDGGRIAGEGGKHREGEPSQGRRYTKNGGTSFSALPGPRGGDPSGRWPANLLLDETAAVMLDAQSGESRSSGGTGDASKLVDARHGWKPSNTGGFGDTGGASRFFYVAKASKSDRGDANDHPTVKPLDLLKYLCILTATPTGGIVLDPFCGSGTTIAAAKATGRQAIGIDREARYVKIAVNRLRQEVLPL